MSDQIKSDKQQEILKIAAGDSFTIVGRHQIVVCQVLSVRQRDCCCEDRITPEAVLAIEEVLSRG